MPTRPLLPSDFPGLALWLDASDASTIDTTGNEVVEFRDKSGNGYNFSPATADTLSTSGVEAINGLNAVNVPIGGTLHAPNFPAWGDAARTMVGTFGAFADAASADPSADRNFFTLGPATGGANGSTWNLTGRASDGGVRLQFQGGGANSVTHSALLAGIWGAQSKINDATSVYVELGYNGDYTIRFPAAVLITASGAYLGYGSDKGAGPVGEVVLYDSFLSLDDRKKVEGYLAHKWGFAAGLAADHPYKDAAPTIEVVATFVDVYASALVAFETDATYEIKFNSGDFGFSDFGEGDFGVVTVYEPYAAIAIEVTNDFRTALTHVVHGDFDVTFTAEVEPFIVNDVSVSTDFDTTTFFKPSLLLASSTVSVSIDFDAIVYPKFMWEPSDREQAELWSPISAGDETWTPIPRSGELWTEL